MTSNKKASLKLVIKKGINLTEQELSQIKKDILREFKIAFNMDDQAKEKLFFLLKQEMGSLWEVKPVIFNGENFSIYGVLNVIANIKGKGYGKRIVTSMIKYLVFHNKTAFGFCMPQNSGFYEKCGFTIDTVSTKRFVYTKGKERITNQDGQVIFYQDASDHFMEKVLAFPDRKVSIPTASLW